MEDEAEMSDPFTPTFRIRTKVGTLQVYTLYVIDKWTTILSGNGIKTEYYDAANLPLAAYNHIEACKKAKSV